MRKLFLLAILCGAVACDGRGCSTVPIGFFAGPSLFAIDFAGSSPPGITAARTGNTLYLQTSASTLVQSSTLSATLREDRGDGRGAGTWTLPAYTNDVTAPFHHSTGAGWSQYNTGVSIVYSDQVAAGPDGSTLYDTEQDTSASDRTQVYGTFGTGSAFRAHSEWVRGNSINPPTAGGMLSGDPAGTLGTTFGTGATWNRVVHVYNGLPSHAHMGPGSAPGPTFTTTETGAFDLWGDQSVLSSTDLPLVNGSTGAATLQIASGQLGDILQTGDLDVQGSFLTEEPSTAFDAGGYAYSMATTSGAFSLRYDSASGDWIFAARGSDLLTSAPHQYIPVGALVSWRTWYRPSTLAAGMSISINGAQDFQGGDITGTATSGAIATPTSLYLGSNGGSSGYLPARHVSFAVATATSLLAEVVVLGDSIAAYHGIDQPVSSGYIYTPTQARTRPGIASLAVVGNTLSQQQTAFTSSPFFGATYVRAVIIEAGINDVNAGTTPGPVGTVGTVEYKYQALVNLIHANNPGAKVICDKLTPDKAYSDTLNVAYYTNWQTVNTAITGGTITGCDAVMSSASDTMNDGSGNLAGPFNSGDDIHPISSGRKLLGSGWAASLHSVGVL